MTNRVSLDEVNVVPTRIDEEIRRDEKESQESMEEEFKRISRHQSVKHAQENTYDIQYTIIDKELGFQDVLDVLKGENSHILEKQHYFNNGDTEIDSEYVAGKEKMDLQTYMEWFFTPEEVQEVRKVDMMADDIPAWNNVYWVGGHSTEYEDQREFGPYDSFEGPQLKYAMVAVNDEETESLFDYSAIETTVYHPEIKLDNYTDNGTYPQDVLKEGHQIIAQK